MVIDCRGPMKFKTMHNCILSKVITYVDRYDDMDYPMVSTIYRSIIDLAVQPENIICEATKMVDTIKPMVSVKPRFLQKALAKVVAAVMKHSDSNFTFTYLGKLELPDGVKQKIADFNFRSWTDFGECNIAAVDFDGTLILNICENYEDENVMKNSFVIKGNICQTKNSKELDLHEQAFVVCVDGISKGIFEELPEEYAKFPFFDYGDAMVFPGMVDLHIHAPQYAFRGMCMDLELMDWLNQYTFPEEEKYENLEYAKKAYSMFTEALKKGATTRACIFATRHRYATELLMGLMEESGLVSYVGKVNMDREASEALTEKSADISAYTTFGWLNAVKDKFERTMPILTPRFIPCCTDKLMEELREIQMAYGIPVQSHLSESKGEIDFVKFLRPENEFYGDSYNEYDLFGKNDDINTDVKTVMAHCVWSTDAEVELMQKNEVFVAHCPASNMNLTSGIAPIRKYMEKGLHIGLGTDVAGGHSESVFRAITDAIQVSKMYFRMVDESCKPLVFSEAFYLATKGGGSFFGKVGSFEEGYEFDAVVLDDSVLLHPQKLNLAERMERAVYLGLDEKNITAKFIAGRKIL